jgi:hypothetical protein
MDLKQIIIANHFANAQQAFICLTQDCVDEEGTQYDPLWKQNALEQAPTLQAIEAIFYDLQNNFDFQGTELLITINRQGDGRVNMYARKTLQNFQLGQVVFSHEPQNFFNDEVIPILKEVIGE